MCEMPSNTGIEYLTLGDGEPVKAIKFSGAFEGYAAKSESYDGLAPQRALSNWREVFEVSPNQSSATKERI